MSSRDLERLRLLLAGLREPTAATESEKRALETSSQLWRCRSGQDRRSGKDRRRRAVLVERIGEVGSTGVQRRKP